MIYALLKSAKTKAQSLILQGESFAKESLAIFCDSQSLFKQNL